MKVLLEELFEEMEAFPKVDWEKENKCRFFLFPDLEIFLEKLPKEIKISASIAPFPSEKKEEILSKLMEANLLGKGTAGGLISLDEKEAFFILSLELPETIGYPFFRDSLEDFTNYLFYWRDWIDTYLKPSILK